MKFLKNKTPKRVAALALGASLFAAACGGNATTTADSGSSGNPLLTGTVGTVSGGQFDLGSLEGQDAVLWFWAPW